MSVDAKRARELADLLEPPFDLKDISLHDMRQASEQLRALADEVERMEQLEMQNSIERETIWRPLLDRCEEFLDVLGNDPEVHDFSQCESEATVEKRMETTQYSTAEAGCPYATFAERIRAARESVKP